MGPNNTAQSPEKKKLVAGVCCFSLVGLVSLAAFVCSIYSYAYCDFVERTVSLDPSISEGDEDSITQACNSLGFTNAAVCKTLLQPHAIGFSYWQGTVPVDQKVCFSYMQLTPFGYISPDLDSTFIASAWMATLGYIFGAFGWFTWAFANCCRIDQKRLMGTSCTFLLASLFSGLSLLMFQSGACDAGFFAPYFVAPANMNDPDKIAEFNSVVTGVTCSLSQGSNMAISACVLYFVSALMIPCSIVPGYADQQAWALQQEQQEGEPLVVEGENGEP